jgi:hypothetical protein
MIGFHWAATLVKPAHIQRFIPEFSRRTEKLPGAINGL